MSTTEDNTRGHVYILSNSAMPGLLKIGFTKGDVEARARQLRTTGVPRPFRVEAKIRAKYAHGTEGKIHKALARYRDSHDREFFRMDVPEAIRVCETAMKLHMQEFMQQEGRRKLTGWKSQLLGAGAIITVLGFHAPIAAISFVALSAFAIRTERPCLIADLLRFPSIFGLRSQIATVATAMGYAGYQLGLVDVVPSFL